jgi:ABC-type transport system involved in multi-copper enzyme maturation permease subunit
MAALALIRRELVTSLRSIRVLVFLSLLLGGATVVVMTSWPGSANVSFIALSGYSERLLEHIGVAQLCAGLLLLPGIAGVAVTGEREQGTYEMLRATAIGPWAMVCAKAINALGIYLLLIIAGLPILGVIFFLVGVEWPRLLLMNAVIVSSAFSVAATSLFCSIRLRRTVTSAVASYFAMLCCMGLPIVVFGFTAELFRWSVMPDTLAVDPLARLADMARLLIGVLPGYDMSGWYSTGDEAVLLRIMSLFSPILLFTANTSDFDTAAVPAYACIWQLLIAWVFYVKSARRLRREQFDTAAAKPVRKPTGVPGFPHRFPYYLIDPGKAPAPIDETGNPMLRKELRWGMLGRATTLVRIFYGVFIFSMLLYASVSLVTSNSGEIIMLGMGLSTLIACVGGPALLAGILTKEYAESNLDMLRMTLLPPGHVFRGKLLGGMINFLPLLLPGALVGVLCAGIFTNFSPAPQLFATFVVCLIAMGVIAMICVACAMVAALVAHQANTAFLTSYLMITALIMGLWFGATAIARAIFPSPYTVFQNISMLTGPQRGMYERFLLARDIARGASPFHATEQLADSLTRRGMTSAQTLGDLAIWAGSMLLFVALSLVLLRFARWRFIRKFKAE